MEVKTNTFYGLRTVAKKVIKYGQVKNLVLHQQMKTPTYFVKYGKEENQVQALMELTKEKGVAKVIAVEKKKENMRNSVTMDHCFGEEKSKKLLKEGKLQDGYSAHLKKEGRNISKAATSERQLYC